MLSARLPDARHDLLWPDVRWAGHQRLWRGLILMACSIAAPILAGMLAGRFAGGAVTALWFAPPIFLIALWGGMAPAAVTIVVALIAFDYWVLPPHHSLILTHVSDLWMAMGLAPCAAIASFLGVRLRRQLRTIRKHERRSEALRLLSHAVVAQGPAEAVYGAAADVLSRAYEARAVILVGAGGTLELAGGSRGASVGEGDLRAADWSLVNNAPAGLGCEVGAASRYDFWPLTTPTVSIVLGVERREGGSEEGLRDGTVELVAGYLLACARPKPLYVVR